MTIAQRFRACCPNPGVPPSSAAAGLNFLRRWNLLTFCTQHGFLFLGSDLGNTPFNVGYPRPTELSPEGTAEIQSHK